MATANVVRAWTDRQGNAHLAVAVTEGASAGTVEYVGTVDAQTWAALPDAPAKKAALIAAVTAVRDAQTGGNVDLAGMSGQVAI